MRALKKKAMAIWGLRRSLNITSSKTIEFEVKHENQG